MTEKNVQSFTHPVAPGCRSVVVRVGDTVRDDLLSGGPNNVFHKAKVLEIWKDDSGSFTTFGVKLDSEYLDGLRHPWEITPIGASEKTNS